MISLIYVFSLCLIFIMDYTFNASNYIFYLMFITPFILPIFNLFQNYSKSYRLNDIFSYKN